MHCHLRGVAGKKLRDPSNPVADHIVKELSRQSADPVPLVHEKRSRKSAVPEAVTVITLHVYWNAAQVATLDERSHSSRHVAKLIVMAYSELELPLIG
jgi:hypothetical protein